MTPSNIVVGSLVAKAGGVSPLLPASPNVTGPFVVTAISTDGTVLTLGYTDPTSNLPKTLTTLTANVIALDPARIPPPLVQWPS
jgi:hypothetical protein